MIQFLIDLDTVLFLLINVVMANPVTNFIMPIITSNDILRASYGATMILLLWRGNSKVRWMVLISAITLASTDQLSSHFLKPLVDRIRPCHVLEHINLLVHCGGGLSMPSSHAANSFGQALLFGFHFPRVRPYLLILATVIGLSRIFVGVHYPGDVLVGALVGSTVGLILALLFGKIPFGPAVSRDAEKEKAKEDAAED